MQEQDGDLVSDRVLKSGLVVGAIVLGVLFFMAGCVPSLNDVRKTLIAAEKVGSAAITSIERYDFDHQMAIVQESVKSGNLDYGKAELLEYRAKRAKVVKAVNDVMALVAAGSALVPLVEAGVQKSVDINAWLAKMLVAVNALQQAMTTFGIPPIPGSFPSMTYSPTAQQADAGPAPGSI